MERRIFNLLAAVFRRKAIASICISAGIINGGLGILGAIGDNEVARGWHSRIFWVVYAAANISLGVLGVGLEHRAKVRERRVALGQCPTCGYDLRATPDRCPECGTAVMQTKREGETV